MNQQDINCVVVVVVVVVVVDGAGATIAVAGQVMFTFQ